ncbi:MAG: hypothetical protein K8953_10085, partial [Proteobacteria bacterium]|nr:hypothetical protein [Pseudomonadota bacterium]
CETIATSFTDYCAGADTGETKVKIARDMACETLTATGAGTGNDCAVRPNIVAACTEENPFANAGCGTATKITPEIRTAFCQDTDADTGKNPFNAGCTVAIDPDLEANRDTACAENGIGADATCNVRPNIMMACTAETPFAVAGCKDAMDIDDTIRTTYCTTGKSIFHPSCEDSTHGEVNAARTRLVATCMEAPDSYFCTTVRIDGSAHSNSNTSSTIRQCNDNPFKTDCATIPEFNAGRISICTTDATSFTTGCVDATHGEVNAAQARFAAACADTSSSTAGCDTPITGVSGGTSVMACNTNPFDATDDCATNPAFNAGRMSICTTEATLFNPGCTNDNYDTSGDARAALIAECAGVSPPVKCTTIYVDGSTATGTSVATCIADPFNVGCGVSIVDNTFAAARTERTALCSATNDPFNAACEIDQFPTMNEANRNTYCRETALPAEGGAGENCGDAIKTAICGATATHNPFAPLCSDDGDNAASRGTFCSLSEQNATPNCRSDVATLCTANPFGTKLGTAADVDCTASYATER